MKSSPLFHPLRDCGVAAVCLMALVLVVSRGEAASGTSPERGSQLSLPSPEFAAWYSKYFSGLATRSRVIQVCVVTMCLALLILMKKFSEDSGKRRPGASWSNEDGRRSVPEAVGSSLRESPGDGKAKTASSPDTGH